MTDQLLGVNLVVLLVLLLLLLHLNCLLLRLDILLLLLAYLLGVHVVLGPSSLLLGRAHDQTVTILPCRVNLSSIQVSDHLPLRLHEWLMVLDSELLWLVGLLSVAKLTRGLCHNHILDIVVY
jgi:hypothetical protein